ncbi:MAG: Cysteine-rich domain protein [Candidatus Argoarchaeum ethanivorans]|uniref:Cysteine-rich domain protein n=1 Tax=Candidatus Argoarchaeum ethanivorans TaxID=2608793 RepID=A0A811T870_9EURY|nr:MAG: Cysteine-rich domain protein [Candidatus Argoarchaeum ethanivorans]
MTDYAVFWGCTIQARFPFMEKSTKLVLDRIGVSLHEIDGVTCCPTKLIKLADEFTWYVTAARNLSLVENMGMDLVTPCNGCYSTLKSAASELNMNAQLRDEVNEILAEAGLEYKGTIHVKHLVEVLYDDIGIDKIKKHVVKPFDGMNIAVHYGCHMIRPSSAIHFDNPNHPTKFDLIVEALSANSIDYSTKMLCCGNDLNNTDDSSNAIVLARQKILEVQEMADAMTMTCPACFSQFDSKQYLLEKSGERLHMPILCLTELIGLAFGFEPSELGMNLHRVETESFIEKWHECSENLKNARQYFDLADLRRCYECAACVDDCPVTKPIPQFEPNQIIGKIIRGRLNEVVESHEIWYCTNCYTCYELCPQKFGMIKVFDRLKSLAGERGIAPDGFKGSLKMFLDTGKLGEPTTVRKRLKLSKPPQSGADELKKLIDTIKSRGK